jgi:Tfp pilus assembly protein PilF
MRGPFNILKSVLAFSFAVAALSAGCTRDPKAAALKYLKRGDESAKAGKYSQAAIDYAAATKYDPQLGEAHLRLADTIATLGDAPKALREYVRAADLLPERPDVQIKTGTALLQARRFEDARARAQAVLQRDLRNADALVLFGSALAGLGEAESAIDKLEEALRANPDNPDLYTGLGAILMTRGRNADAELAFKNAVRARPDSIKAQLALANYYWATNQNDKIEEPLKRAAAIDPDHVLTNRALALFYIATARPAEAEAPLRKLAMTLATINGRIALSDYYVLTNRLDDARSVLNQLLKQKDVPSIASVRLASVERSAHRCGEAQKILDAVLVKEPPLCL